MNNGKKYDKEKIRYDLVEPSFVEGVASVLTMGAGKYGANNWQNLSNGSDRYYAALIRHIQAWRQGEQIDKESGLSHLHHVATNVMFLEYFDKNKGVSDKEVVEFITAFYKKSLSKNYSTSG